MSQRPLDFILKEIETLNVDDLLELHREVCRMAAPIYGTLTREKQRLNHATAMRMRAWRK